MELASVGLIYFSAFFLFVYLLKICPCLPLRFEDMVKHDFAFVTHDWNSLLNPNAKMRFQISSTNNSLPVNPDSQLPHDGPRAMHSGMCSR
jgi:hypothetical protein